MNRRGVSIWIMVFCLLGCGVASAQLPSLLPKLEASYTNHFSESDIPYADNCFKHLFSDQQGRLWLVPCGVQQLITGANLYQFDGYQFRFVPIRRADSSRVDALAFQEVSPNGQILGWTRQSEFFLADTDTWQPRFIPTADQTLGPLEIRNTAVVDEQIYLSALSARDSILLMRLEQDSLRLLAAFDYSGGIWRTGRYPLVVDSAEIWLSGASLPIYRLDRETGRIRAFRQKDFQPNPALRAIGTGNLAGIQPTILKQKEEVFLYLPGYYGHLLFRLDREKDQFISIKEYFPANWTPEQIFRDETGNICFLFRDPDGAYRSLLRSPAGKWLNYSAITRARGQITEMRGHDFQQEVLLIGPDGLSSIGVRQDRALTTILEGKPVNSMAELPDGRLLINVQGPPWWYTYDPLSGQTVAFTGPDCGVSPPVFSRGMKQQIIPDKKGHLWFTSQQHLVRYNPITNDCTAFDLSDNASLFGFINDELLAIQTKQSLLFYNTRNREQLEVPTDLANFSDRFIRDIFIDTKGLIWLPSNEGLWQIDLAAERLARVDQGKDFADTRFTAIYEDEQGLFWIGTYFGGLHLYDPETENIRILNQEQGLASNAIMSILPDADGDIWLGTEQGISLVSKTGEIWGSFHREDGLNDEKFQRFDPLRTNDGLLYFNNRGGINVLNPRQLKQALAKRPQPQLFLTELAHFDRETGEEQIQINAFDKLDRVRIPATRPYIRLKFGLSSYLEPQENRYAYRLDRPGENWQYLGSQPELFINRLPPGKYNLLIKGADFRNRWTEPVAIPVRTRQIFYKQAWFYLLLSLPFLIFAAVWVENKRREARRLEREVAERTQKIQRDKVLIEEQATQLQELDQLKNKFFVHVAHELRTPITLVTTPLEHLLGRKTGKLEQETEQELQRILLNAENLEDRVEEFLELARLTTEKPVLETSPTALVNYCWSLFDAFQPLATRNQIDYQFSSELEAEAVYLIDRKRLAKVLNNLLSNAFKFTPEGGKISMQIRQTDPGLEIAVSDKGLGIAKEDLPYIFDPYFQTQANKGGIGIGLALSKELAQLMRGRLFVKSQPGAGSTFTLQLPLQPIEVDSTPEPLQPVAREPEVAGAQSLKKSQKGKILIVEDHPEMQQLLQKLLSDQYHCVLANHGLEAWQWLAKNDARLQGIELILTDIMMPEMDGYALLEKIKNHPQWQGVPVIMLTALKEKAHKIKGLRIGVDDYVSKPFSAVELQARVANLIRNYRTRSKSPDTAEDAPSQQSVSDQEWLAEIEQAAQEALAQRKKLNTAYLANQIFLSERHLLRKLKTLTGLTPNAYIQEIKLQKARELLEQKTYSTVGEVAQASGYQSASYLAKIYQQRFGKSPSDYFTDSSA